MHLPYARHARAARAFRCTPTPARAGRAAFAGALVKNAGASTGVPTAQVAGFLWFVDMVCAPDARSSLLAPPPYTAPTHSPPTCYPPSPRAFYPPLHTYHFPHPTHTHTHLHHHTAACTTTATIFHTPTTYTCHTCTRTHTPLLVGVARMLSHLHWWHSAPLAICAAGVVGERAANLPARRAVPSFRYHLCRMFSFAAAVLAAV